MARNLGRWWLVGMLTVAPAHADAVRFSAPATPSAGVAGREPESEEKREACVNGKSLPWLPAVELPHPERAGQAALGWRPGADRAQRWRWLPVALAAAVLSVALAVGLRRRPGWRRVAVVPALGPLVPGFWCCHEHLDRLADGLAQTWLCIPREGVFQRNAQLARDVLAVASLASAAAWLALGLVAAWLWRPWRPCVVVPSVLLSVAGAWAGGSWWPGGREDELARQVGALAGVVNASGVRLPVVSDPAPVRVPDVPLVMITSGGEVSYDDSRGRRAPTPLPHLLPRAFSWWDLEKDEADRPPFFALAIDERTRWETLWRAVEPLDAMGYRYRHWALLGAPSEPSPGAAAMASSLVFWLPDAEALSRLYTGVYRRSPLTTLGWYEEGGLRLQGEPGMLTPECGRAGEDPFAVREPIDLAQLARCVREMEQPGTVVEWPDEVSFVLIPSATTEWRDVVSVVALFARPRPAGAWHLNLEVAPDREQALQHLSRPPLTEAAPGGRVHTYRPPTR